MFPLLETIRIENGEITNPSYHEERMDRSLKILFGKRELPDLKNILSNHTFDQNEILKCRLLYSSNDYQISFDRYKKRAINSLIIIEITDFYYDLKYSDRSFFDSFKLKDGHTEIIFTKNGHLTDTRYTNIAFLKEDAWITPDKPLLKGTQRANLIDHGILLPGEIRIENIDKFSKIRLINAMMPWDDCIELNIEQIEKND